MKTRLMMLWVCLVALPVVSASGAEDLRTPTLLHPVMLNSSGEASVYALSPTTSITRNQDLRELPSIHRSDQLYLAAARNESEQFTLVLHPKSNLSDVRLVFSKMEGPRSLTSEIWSYAQALAVPVEKVSRWYGTLGAQTGHIFDPLVQVETVDAPADRNTAVLVTVNVPADASPGLYAGRLEVRAGDRTIAAVDLNLEVWDILLPTNPTLITESTENERSARGWRFMRENHVQWLKYGTGGVDVSYDRKTGKLTIDTEGYRERLKVLLEEIGIQRIALPPSLLGGGGTRISQSYLGTGIAVGDEEFWPIYDQYMAQMGDFYRENGWVDRVFFYMTDEMKEEYYPLIEKLARRAKQAFPEITLLVVQNDMPDELAEVMDIWVVPWHFFVTSSEDICRWDKLRAEGLELWAYMNSLYTLNAESTLGNMRIYPVALAKYGYEGNLWWSLVHYGPRGQGHPNPWHEGIATLTREEENKRHYANGYLFYPPRNDEEYWHTSLRWESYLQGLDEYELLEILRHRLDDVRDELGAAAHAAFLDPDRAVRWWGGVMADEFRLQTYRPDASYIHRFRQLLAHEIIALAQPPFGIVVSPEDQAMRTANNTLHLRGACAARTQVLVNGEPIPGFSPADTPRLFSVNVPLEQGANLVSITFRDDQGNTKTLYREINRR